METEGRKLFPTHKERLEAAKAYDDIAPNKNLKDVIANHEQIVREMAFHAGIRHMFPIMESAMKEAFEAGRDMIAGEFTWSSFESWWDSLYVDKEKAYWDAEKEKDKK